MTTSLPAQCEQLLRSGCSAMQIDVSEPQIQLLLAYTEQLHKWNKAYNLTAIRQPVEMLKLHILDSLSVVKELAKLEPQRIIDVGTGPGLPGMILAIMWPHLSIDLLDTNGKKTRFLTHCKHLFKLDNVTVLNKRVEQHQPEQAYDVVVSRAFASISDMLGGCDQLVAPSGVFAPMKGQYPDAELAEMPNSYKLVSSHLLTVPDVDAERHLLIIAKQA
jgi:16S rRNA (guanine527-N7)-methyltransferase